MKSKHTPGQWKVSDTSITNAEDTICIAVIETDGGYEAPAEERQANAALIAAAPELLAAVELLHAATVRVQAELTTAALVELCAAQDVASSAIAKAKGQP